MVDVTGLKSPYTRKFGGKIYRIDSRANLKSTAKLIAASHRRNGREARVIQVKKGQRYAIYVRR